MRQRVVWPTAERDYAPACINHLTRAERDLFAEAKASALGYRAPR